MDSRYANSIRTLLDRLVPPRLRHDALHLHMARRLVAFHLAMFFWVPVFGFVNLALDAPLSALILVGGGVGVFVSFATFWWTQSPAICGNVVGFSAWALYSALAAVNGGIHAPVLIWYASIPVLTLLMCGPKPALYWTVACALTVVVFFIAAISDYSVFDELTAAARQWLSLAAVLGLLLCIYTLVWLLNTMDLRTQRALREINQLLEVQASTDGLTGFANRRCFDEVFTSEWKRHDRALLPLSVAMLDIDFFKQFNDARGHIEGDLCLKAVADELRKGVRRPSDFLARYGGEEFVILLPNTSEVDAARLLEQIRGSVKMLRIPHPDSAISSYVTISIGVASAIPSQCGSRLDLLHEADSALYRAKTQGRDQTVLAGDFCVATV